MSPMGEMGDIFWYFLCFYFTLNAVNNILSITESNIPINQETCKYIYTVAIKYIYLQRKETKKNGKERLDYN